jgi:hypothetical protein
MPYEYLAIEWKIFLNAGISISRNIGKSMQKLAASASPVQLAQRFVLNSLRSNSAMTTKIRQGA